LPVSSCYNQSDPDVKENKAKQLYILRRKKGGYGGAEKVVSKFMKSLGQNWQVSVINEGNNLDGHQIGTDKGPNWLRAKKYARTVDQFFQNRDACLVFSMERGPACDVYRAGDGVHRRWIAIRYKHSLRWIFNPWHWVAPSLERKTFEAARAIVANSKMVRDDIARYYPDCEKKVTVIYNGFDPAVYSPPSLSKSELRSQLGLPDSACSIFFCASGWERKGLNESIAFLAQLQKKNPDSLLWVLGSGKPEQYKGLIAAHGLEKQVIFIPPTLDVAAYYQAADLFILPTAYDPFSNATLEALACGCPVITTCRNGVSEVIEHGKTGFILDQSDAVELAEAVNWWIDYKPDPVLIADSVCELTHQREMEALNKLLLS